VIWLGLAVPVIRERRVWIACAHGGTALFITALFLDLNLPQTGAIADLVWLKVIGFVLFVPALILIIAATVAIARGTLAETGISRIVRHPMYLGTALAAFALILVFQSNLSLVLGVMAIFSLWMASRLEDQYNIERFGDAYRAYMHRVPRWNVLKGLRNK
jgi:protein-S-isoprenylcysteine O-methyltransferase Ste14